MLNLLFLTILLQAGPTVSWTSEVEQTEDGPELIGHAWFQAPDSDGAVHIAEGEACVGDVVTVDLVDSFCYEMVGEIVKGAE